MSKKFLYLFKEGHDAFGGDQTTMKNTLGGKGAGLAEMTHAGMPVPQGFTITTETSRGFSMEPKVLPVCSSRMPMYLKMSALISSLISRLSA